MDSDALDKSIFDKKNAGVSSKYRVSSTCIKPKIAGTNNK